MTKRQRRGGRRCDICPLGALPESHDSRELLRGDEQGHAHAAARGPHGRGGFAGREAPQSRLRIQSRVRAVAATPASRPLTRSTGGPPEGPQGRHTGQDSGGGQGPSGKACPSACPATRGWALSAGPNRAQDRAWGRVWGRARGRAWDRAWGRGAARPAHGHRRGEPPGQGCWPPKALEGFRAGSVLCRTPWRCGKMGPEGSGGEPQGQSSAGNGQARRVGGLASPHQRGLLTVRGLGGTYP